MSGYGRQAIFTVSIAVVIAVAIGAGVYYLQPQLTGSSTTSVATTTCSSYSGIGECGQATNQKTGLQLQLSINSTEFASGSPMLIIIGEYNTLSTINNVTIANNYPIPNLELPNILDPFGIAIFKGNYAMSNVSKGSAITPLFQMYLPGMCCPAIALPQNYIFQPESYYATYPPQSSVTSTETFVTTSVTNTITYIFTTTFTGTTYSLRPITDSVSLSGSISNFTSSSPFAFSVENFSAGNYTLVGGDEWGELVFLHFEIV